jgi:hypothetical protein
MNTLARSAFGIVVLCAAVLRPAAALAVELRQIISREHPVFVGTGQGLAVNGGNAYFYSSAQGKGYVLRVSLDGKSRFGGETVYAITGIAANARGVVATSNAHFAKSVNLYGPQFESLGKAEGFTGNDEVGWDGPGNVESGASGDFYALDQHQNRIVRIDSEGKIVRSYPVDADAKPGRSTLRSQRFRVCEATKRFVFHAGDELRCTDFEGRTQWTKKVALVGNSYDGFRGDFDLDEAGDLYLMPWDKPRIERFNAAGEAAGLIELQMGDAGPSNAQPLSNLRVVGDRIVVRRKSDTELFQAFDRVGKRLHVESIQYEKLTVRFDSPVWTLGESIPLSIDFEAPGRKDRPDLRCWVRSLEESVFRPLTIENGSVTLDAREIPTGLYHIRVCSGLAGSESEYQVQTAVEVRTKGAVGSISILTPRNRTSFGVGEPIPLRVIVRAGPDVERPREVKVDILGEWGPVWSDRIAISPEGVGTTLIPAEKAEEMKVLSRVIVPSVDRTKWTVAGQRIEIGPGLPTPPKFNLIQYGDYRVSYPEANFWNAKERIVRHVRANQKLGTNMFVDRLGHGGGGVLHEIPNVFRDPELVERLKADPIAVAPEKAEFDNRVLQSVAAYGAAGMEQRGILLYMDAGLPVGTGFDKRTDAEYERDITLVSSTLKDFAAFRGWSWAANWWIDKRGAAVATSPEQKTAYEASLVAARETGRWLSPLDRLSDVWINHAVDAERKFDAILQKAAPGRLSAMTGPYRQPGIHPPLSFANADEVDLHWQAEQIQWPEISAHAVDFYKRPGKRAWAHPELWNDDGTGAQILSTAFTYLMRGANGFGQSGSTHGFAPPPSDPRGMGPGATSVHRALNTLLKTHGPWLENFEAADPVAIPVSTRMMRLDLDWMGVGGRYFSRLFEAYNACLHAHRPASFVFAEDCRPDSFLKYRGVLVVDQEVDFDPPLAEALRNAAAKGVTVWHDKTCRADVVNGFRPLDIAFNRVEADPHVLNDDSAFGRFRGYFLEHAAALSTAWESAVPAVAVCPNPEVLLTERRHKDVRILWVVNQTAPPLDLAQLWRVGLDVSSRLPVATEVSWNVGNGYTIYDLFGGESFDGSRPIRVRFGGLHAKLFVAIPERTRLYEHGLPAGVRRAFDSEIAARLRDVAVDASGTKALVTIAGWDRNILTVDLETGAPKTNAPNSARVGHHFSYSPTPAGEGFAVQGYDLNSAEGYHLYLLDANGSAERRFALFGLPKRGTNWATARTFLDSINNFAVSSDGSWIAAAGDLGMAVWSRDGEVQWTDDWSRAERRRTPLLAAGSESLIVLNGDTVTARNPRDGKPQWTHRLGTTGRLIGGVATPDGKTIALRSTAEGGRVFIVQDGKPLNVLPTASDDLSLAPDGRWLAVVNGSELRMYDTTSGMKWSFTGDEVLRSPRFDRTSKRVAVGSELGTLVVLNVDGTQELVRDLEALPVVAWLDDGGLLAATWLGRLTRLDAKFQHVWSKVIEAGSIAPHQVLAADVMPTSRIAAWGNAAKEPLSLTPNLLADTQALIEARCDPATHGDPRTWHNPIKLLTDGDATPPEKPWLEQTDLSYLDSGWRSKLAIQVDTFRTQLRVTGVTIVEDAKHPESWQRDMRLQYWDPKGEAWRDGPYLLSDQAVHSHVFDKPIESAKFRFVTTGGGSWPANNIRWAELVFHGEALGPSHPDAVANRPVAVLFDEQEDDLKSLMAYGGRPFAFKYDDAASGGKSISLTAAGETTANWRPPFGHVLPNWDFQIVENPSKPGEYRWAEFWWKALSPETKGATLRLGPHHGSGVAVSAGEATKMEGAAVLRESEAGPSSEWTRVRVDLWKAHGEKPFAVRSLGLGAAGGGAAFDRILLGRSVEDFEKTSK